MKMVYSKSSVLKKVKFAVQTVHMETTGNVMMRARESGFKDQEGMPGCLTGL